MVSLGLNGPYELDSKTIDAVITRTGAGNYALGSENDKGGLTVEYVGRSDTDVNSRLKQHAAKGTYTHFKFGYATSPKAAFEKECQNFHDFGETSLANKIHPDRPENASWKCPACEIYD
ncbi:hypothetical protein [Aeromonas caviae]|uniref:hypothetical protein n=1 Tax=Aeromonas caviae TaxID=648 RepID=UPI002B480BCC|nr:hypothetical protein [Aeromonas caviae]